jgi:general secretion pathway protein H
MQTLATGNKENSNGFTILELLIVVFLLAVATVAVSLSLRDSSETALEHEANRLAVLLENGRAQARANGSPVVWHTEIIDGTQNFIFDGLRTENLPKTWLNKNTRVTPNTFITLGPEPLIPSQSVEISNLLLPGRKLWIFTDGLRPFKVQNNNNFTEQN